MAGPDRIARNHTRSYEPTGSQIPVPRSYSSLGPAHRANSQSKVALPREAARHRPLGSSSANQRSVPCGNDHNISPAPRQPRDKPRPAMGLPNGSSALRPALAPPPAEVPGSAVRECQVLPPPHRVGGSLGPALDPRLCRWTRRPRQPRAGSARSV